jgi:type I restriction enzyme S subunit
MLLPGTLIIANSGATLGIAKILDLKCCANDGIAALINHRSGDKPFLCYYINTQTDRLRDVVATGNGQPNLNTALISKIRVPFPAAGEQRAIAEALSDVDRLLGALETLIAKKRAIKQATLQQLLTGKTRLPGFNGEWKRIRLAELGPFLKGSGVKRDDSQSGTLPCVRYGEIYTTHQDYIRGFHSWISADVAATATRLEYGDLLFAGSGETKIEIGKCVALVTETEAYAGGDIVILRPARVNSLFLGYALNMPDAARQKASFGQGDAVVHISATALGQVAIALPPTEEQTAIATVLSDIDSEVTALEARRDKTRAIKQGMMQQLLTGRVRLVKPRGESDAD